MAPPRSGGRNITTDLLPKMLRAYRERFPHVEVALRELTTPAQVKALDENELQVGLLRLPISTLLVPQSIHNLRSEGNVYRELEGATTMTEIALAWRRDAQHSAIVQNFLTVARETIV